MTKPRIPNLLVKQLSTLTETWASAPALRTREEYLRAVDALVWMQKMRRAIETLFRELKRTANDHRNNLLDQEKKYLGGSRPVEQSLNDLIVNYDRQRTELAKEAARAALEHPSGTSILSHSELETPPEGYHAIPRLTVCVTDKLALITAVSEGRVELEALTVNATFLRKQAEEQGVLINVPGIRIDRAFTIVTHHEK